MSYVIRQSEEPLMLPPQVRTTCVSCVLVNALINE